MIQVRRVRMLLELYLIFGRLSYSGVSKVTWGFMLNEEESIRKFL